jgi:hypothetical protein
VTEAWFHDDDYGQVEVLPLVNLNFCLKQAGLIERFAQKHEAGLGWDAMFVRADAPAALSELGLRLAQVRKSVTPQLVEANAVFTGYSSYRERCDDVFAFAAASGETLFVQARGGDTVTAIWLSDAMSELLLLPKIDELLLVDWRFDFVCPLTDVLRLEAFLVDHDFEN